MTRAILEQEKALLKSHTMRSKVSNAGKSQLNESGKLKTESYYGIGTFTANVLGITSNPEEKK